MKETPSKTAMIIAATAHVMMHKLTRPWSMSVTDKGMSINTSSVVDNDFVKLAADDLDFLCQYLTTDDIAALHFFLVLYDFGLAATANWTVMVRDGGYEMQLTCDADAEAFAQALMDNGVAVPPIAQEATNADR